MNTTESLDGAGKSPDLSSVTGETAITGDTSVTENKRRRLVRSAVALAPLVLTLRSGALAAASCTGAKALGKLTKVTIPNVGDRYRIDNLDSLSSPPAAGDVCATSTTQCTEFSEGATPHLKIQGGGANGNVRGPNNNGKFFCVGGTYTEDQPVAILSSASANSLYNPP